MSLIKPISFLQRKRVVAPTPGGGIPQEANILMRFENVNVNNSGGNWTDTSGLGFLTGRVENGAVIDATSNSVQLNNTVFRTRRFRVTTTSNLLFKSVVVVFNSPFNQNGSGTARNYFWDMRKASTVGNGGFFNQYDGVGGGATELFGGNGNYFAYGEDDGILLPSQLTTSANLTDGVNKSNGGAAIDQWLGPNGKAVYLPKRMWLFNFNTARDLSLTTNAVQGLMFGANDNGSEGGSLGFFSIIGWSTYLDATDASNLVQYFKDQGVLT